MKKLTLSLLFLAATMAVGTGLKAQEVTRTLMPGWTWISCPTTDTMNLATALGSFVPMQNDVITTQGGTAVYLNGQWRGNLSKFYPGYGYHYKSNRTGPVTVAFQTQQPSSQVAVTTLEPTDITAMSAVVGGTVTINAGNHIFARGVCWGTEEMPNMDGSHTSDEAVAGSQTVTLNGLAPSTIYYVRAYAVTDYGLAYGEELSFTTVVEYQYVDLGLPSGLLWATCNLGATAPEDYGDYFAWGETTPKEYYEWSTYQYCNGSENTLTKYCCYSSHGYDGFTDNLTILLPEDDAATANWGTDWRMATYEEWQELYNYTTSTWTIQNGVKGKLFTASNGNSLFLPAAGYLNGSNLSGADDEGEYWSSSAALSQNWSDPDPFDPFDSSFNPILFDVEPSEMDPDAMIYHFWRISGGTGPCTGIGCDLSSRCSGLPVRPVRSGSQNPSFIIDATANPSEGGEISGEGLFQEGAECTLTATPNEGYTFANWTENDEVVSTDATYTFTVSASRTLVANFIYNGGGNHAYVDLGLPSGLLWATCNVGADVPEDYGDYFAWGETTTKDTYNLNTYQYCMGSISTLTKYCNDSSFGYNGFTDNLTTLLPEDDAATVNWGTDWRMPTQAEWQELLDNTTLTWTTQNGVNGRLFTASNGNSLFLPAAGCRYDSSLLDASSLGYYWSSSLYTDDPYNAWILSYNWGGYVMDYNIRDYGQSVRPVRVGSQN